MHRNRSVALTLAEARFLGSRAHRLGNSRANYEHVTGRNALASRSRRRPGAGVQLGSDTSEG